jgi:hypothetical protein
MRPENILAFLQRKPFQPFRLTLTDGLTYDVGHPELAMIGRATMAIGLATHGPSQPVYDRLVTISLLHVMQVEPLDTASAS